MAGGGRVSLAVARAQRRAPGPSLLGFPRARRFLSQYGTKTNTVDPARGGRPARARPRIRAGRGPLFSVEPQPVQRPPSGSASALVSGSISPSHTGHRTARRTDRPSQAPVIRASSVGSPSTRSRTSGVRVSVLTYDKAPHQPDHLPEHAHLPAANRLHRVVLRLQADVVGLLEVALHGRVLADQRDDDVAVVGCVLALDHDQVPVEDPDVHHRVAANPEQVVALARRPRARAS